MSLKLAPIQIAWLSYPSTLGMECIDYMIADKQVKVSVKMPPNPRQFLGDREQFERVLVNLIENAIKHNIVSEKAPLKVSISQCEEKLIIKNDLNRRKDSSNSTGTGLDNLRRRYALLGLSGPVIEETNTVFSVSIPLIEEL